jgi:signal transduction histidine kinase/sugar phosphate isomerase/epimerase
MSADMRIGYQTILWGPQITDVADVLETIASAGFEGVEFAQPPHLLGSSEELATLLDKHKLVLLGFSSGALKERLAFCAGIHRPLYWYVEDWDAETEKLAEQHELVLALHAHVFKRTSRLSDAAALLRQHPKLKWIPDTAHQTIAGDDPIQALRIVPPARLAAVHLKDWTTVYGRSCHRYSRGFQELGQGDVELEGTVGVLRSLRYDGWVVVEQDFTRTDPKTSVLQSAAWLQAHGLLPAARHPVQVRRRSQPQHYVHSEPELRFVLGLTKAASRESQAYYESVADSFNELIPSHSVSVWSCSPAHDFLSLLSTFPHDIPISKAFLPLEKTLANVALRRHAVTTFNARAEHPAEEWGFADATVAIPELVPPEAESIVIIPVFSTYNHNHERLVITLVPKEPHQFQDNELFHLGNEVGRIADVVLDEFCAVSAAKASKLAGKSQTVDAFAEGLVKLIQGLVGAESATVFVVNESRDRLEPRACTVTLDWRGAKGEEFYTKEDGLTGARVWARGETIITRDPASEPGWAGHSIERLRRPVTSALMVPMFDVHSEVAAVVRCHNKIPTATSKSPMFTDEDVAAIDAVGHAALPHLRALLDNEQRAKAVARLTHELKVPLVTIRAALQAMSKDLKQRGFEPSAFFSRDYLDDAWSYAELMKRHLGNADLMGLETLRMKLRIAPTYLMADVVAPAVRQTQALVKERGFSTSRIEYVDFNQIPLLYVDRNLFQQVVFNLISNAVKYAFDDPGAFNVEISGAKVGSSYLIRCADRGIGVPKGYEHAVFEEGIRAPEAMERYQGGQGIGLWIVRRIIEAHGGTVSVTKSQMPTEITIALPESLSRRRSGPIRLNQ